jgi:hypothetical protein
MGPDDRAIRRRRHEKLGESGLRNGSSRLWHSPRATPLEIVETVLYLRR